jgi:hypothetical protein
VNTHRGRSHDGFPPWLTAFVVVAITLLLSYSVVRYGPAGYPIDIMLGGLIGAYGGFDQLKRRQTQQQQDGGADQPAHVQPPESP